MVKKRKVSDSDGQQAAEELNPFANPEAALEEGSEAQLSVLRGNDIEAPEEDEYAPETGDLRERIKTLIRSADDLYWDLAQAIATVNNSKLYKKWGYSSFEAYVNEECRIDKRKGQYFVQIHNYFSTNLRNILVNSPSTYGEYLSLARQLGWVKARILAKEQVITETNADALLKKIKTCTVRELEDICAVAANELSEAEAEKRTDENVEKLVRLSVQANLAQKDDIEKATEHALTLLSSNATRSSAWSWIARSYLTSETIGRGGEVSIADTLSGLERAFNIRIVAFSGATDDIVYGQDNLQKLVPPEGAGYETANSSSPL